MKNLIVLYTLIAALAVLLVMTLLHRAAKPLVDPATAALVDSLHRTHLADSVMIDQLSARSAKLTQAADSAVARARRATAAGVALGTQGARDAAEARRMTPSTKVDSAAVRLWMSAYDNVVAENDTLHRAIALYAQADSNRVIARGMDTTGIADLRARLARSDAANQGLQTAIDKANRRGHLFGISWLPEPSRTVSAIGGAVVGLVVDQVVIVPRQKKP